MKKILSENVIGTPVLASMIWAMKKPDAYFDVPWRAGADGSPVMLNLVHEVDLLRFLFGDVVSVKGIGSNALRKTARVESGAALLEFANGVAASIAFADSAVSPFGFEAGTGENPNIATTGEDYLRISGTHGTIGFPSLTVWSGAEDWSQAPQVTVHEVEANVPLTAQLEHFCEVCSGKTAPRVSAVEARDTLAATLAIEGAVSQGVAQ